MVILDFVEAEKRREKLQGKFPRTNMHTGNNPSFYYQNHTKSFELTSRVRKQIDEAVQALACAIGFWRPKKNYQGNSPGPVCILQIFGNSLSMGFRVRAETKCLSTSAPPPQSEWRLNNIKYEMTIK